MLIDELLQRFPDARRAGSGWSAKCPAHDDHRASLSISEGDDKRILLHCHAGCEFKTIVGALGLQPKNLMPLATRTRTKRIVETYPYHDETGRVLFESVRYEPKDFRQRQPDGKGGWSWRLNGARRVLYHLPELLKADAAQWVFVVEGEKDADNMRAIGLTATCNPMGAGKWKHVEDGVLAGRKVAILPDRDDTGHEHGLDVAKRLHSKAADVRIVELPTALKDASDFISARRQEGKTDADISGEIMAAVEAAPAFSATPTRRPAAEGKISEWADAFIRIAIAPSWHRDGKSLFSIKMNREIPVGNLWHYLADADIEAIGETSEGVRSESYRGRLLLAKEVILMAAARVIVGLPEATDIEHDETVRADDLCDRLAAWLIHPRSFRNDKGIVITTSYFAWVTELQPAEYWAQCFGDPVFGRMDAGHARIGTQGANMVQEMRYPSARTLLRDLRACGLAVDSAFKIGAKSWRGVEITSTVLDSVARSEK